MRVRGWLSVGVVASVVLGLAPPAAANLAPGSVRPIITGVGDARTLAMPLPVVRSAPALARRGERVVVRVTMGYRASSWRRAEGRKRDRVTVALHVARRLLTTGPDPVGARFTEVVQHRLKRQRVRRSYRFVLPRAVSRELVRAGAFAADRRERRQVRRRVWVDVEQDRDFQHVDGRYDWRQGRAANAGERTVVARAAASNNPSGTLTVQNATSWGFYANDSTPIDSTGYPSAPAETVNNSGVPVVVAAAAQQCFDSGSSSSNPAGFANSAAGSTAPGPYAPGAVVAGPASNPYPFTTGDAVTQPIAADDSIAKASNNEQADTAAYVDGTLNLAFAAASVVVGGVPSGFGGGANIGFLITSSLDVDTIPSPGTIVSAFVDIADAIIAASCDGNANLLGMAAAEPNGGVVGNSMQIQENVFNPFDPQAQETSNDVGYTAPIGGLFGLQVNASSSTYEGSSLWLNTFMEGEGVFGNIGGSGVNYVGIDWMTQNPCVTWQMPATACTAMPATAPQVAAQDLEFDCGEGNADCPFPSAGFPLGTPPLAASPSVTFPAATNAAGTSTISAGCATQVPSGTSSIGVGKVVYSPSGAYGLVMTSAGVLELLDVQSDQIVWSQPGVANGPQAGSTWSMQGDGNLVIDAPGGTVVWAAGTSAAGAYLAVQDDGTVVVWSADGTSPLWASGQPVGAACASPATASASAASGPTDSCATLIAASDTSTYPAGTTFNSPNGRYQLIMVGDGILQLSDLQTQTPVWNSGPTFNQPPPATPAYSFFPGTGFSVTTTQGIVAGQFSTNVSGTGLFAAVQNDGNLVVYAGDGTVLWATGTGAGCAPPTIPGTG